MFKNRALLTRTVDWVAYNIIIPTLVFPFGVLVVLFKSQKVTATHVLGTGDFALLVIVWLAATLAAVWHGDYSNNSHQHKKSILEILQGPMSKVFHVGSLAFYMLVYGLILSERILTGSHTIKPDVLSWVTIWSLVCYTPFCGLQYHSALRADFARYSSEFFGTGT